MSRIETRLNARSADFQANAAAMRAVVADHWEAMMRWMPTYATTVGDHRYDDRIDDVSAAGWQAHVAFADRFLAQIEPLDSIESITLGGGAVLSAAD